MAPKKDPATANKQKGESFAKRTTFYVNIEWQAGCPPDQCTHVRGQMYVESLEPQKKTQNWPIILIHGDYHSSQVWLTKPDGEPGWASYFLGKGFHVYVVDLPGTGKANNLTKETINTAESTSIKASQIERLVTAPELFNHCSNPSWPTALKHDKWPGSGMRGDKVFESYVAGLTPLFFSSEERQTLSQNALSSLLRIIGKAVLIGEGTGATASWLAADVVPALVLGVVAIEPPGPPFCESTVLRQNKRKFDSFTSFDPDRLKYGLSNIPLTFDPPVRPGMGPEFEPTKLHPLDLALFVHVDTRKRIVLQYSPDNLPQGFYLAERLTNGDGAMHVRKLINLSKMRHVIFTGEASSHSAVDVSTIHFMKQAGLTVDCGFLERYKTYGNGHLMFLETNSDDVAAHVMRWIQNRAGHIEEPVVVVEPEVMIAAPPTAVPSPPVVVEDHEAGRSPKRARQIAPHTAGLSFASASQPCLIDLTDEPPQAINHSASGSLLTVSEVKSMLPSLPNVALPQQGVMQPPPRLAQSSWLGPSTPGQENPACTKDERKAPKFDPINPATVIPKDLPAQAPDHFLTTPKPSQASLQHVVPLKEFEGADSRGSERPQTPDDIYYTAPEYPTYSPATISLSSEALGGYIYDFCQTAAQQQQPGPLLQQTIPFPLAAPPSTFSSWQQSSYLRPPMQGECYPPSSLSQAPRSMPDFRPSSRAVEAVADQFWDAGGAGQESAAHGQWTGATFCLSTPGEDELHIDGHAF